jgi:galactonate dehydratase
MGVKHRAQATMAAGTAPFSWMPPARGTSTYNTGERLNQVYEHGVQAREGVGKNGDFVIDFHQRFDLADTMRAALPNLGGITEVVKIAAICATHFVVIVPHFTGPIAADALMNTLARFPGR